MSLFKTKFQLKIYYHEVKKYFNLIRTKKTNCWYGFTFQYKKQNTKNGVLAQIDIELEVVSIVTALSLM